MGAHRPTNSAFAQLPPGSILGLVGVVGLYVFHGLFGAFRADISLGMTIGCAGLLAAALSTSWGRADLAKAPSLLLPGTFFFLVLAAAIWSLTPWTPQQASLAWAHVGVRGSASVDPSSTVLEVCKLLGLGCVFVFGLLLGGSETRGRTILKALVYLGAAFAAMMAVLFVLGIGADAGRPRLEGTFLSPNTAGTVFGALLLLAVAATRSAMRTPSRSSDRTGPIGRAALPGAAALTLLACLVCTASRGALTATGAALIAQLLCDASTMKGRSRMLILASAAVIVVVALFPVLTNEQVLSRFTQISGDVQDRRAIADVHWRAFLEAPLNGYGLGSFDAVNRALIGPSNFAPLWTIHAVHNVYLQWLEEGGLAATVPMFLAIESVIVATIFATARRTRTRSWLHAMLACDLLFILHGFTDFALQTPSVAAFWALLLGLQLAMSRNGTANVASAGWVRLRMGLLQLGALVAVVFAGLFILALNFGGAVGVGKTPLLEVTAGYSRAANQALQGPRPRLVAAEALSVKALRRFPYDTAAWMRIAYIHGRTSRIDADGIAALTNSYQLVPLDPDIGMWRVGFCLEDWADLPPRLQAYVRTEGRILSRIEREKMAGTVKAIQNPAGQIEAASWSPAPQP